VANRALTTGNSVGPYGPLILHFGGIAYLAWIERVGLAIFVALTVDQAGARRLGEGAGPLGAPCGHTLQCYFAVTTHITAAVGPARLVTAVWLADADPLEAKVLRTRAVSAEAVAPVGTTLDAGTSRLAYTRPGQAGILWPGAASAAPAAPIAAALLVGAIWYADAKLFHALLLEPRTGTATAAAAVFPAL
jgi:hypothetical protein